MTTCTNPSGPPCNDLLDDPEAVLADPDRWPDHLCPDLARASTRQWAESRASAFYGDTIPEPVRAWLTTWPLLVSPPLGQSTVPAGLLPFTGPPFSMRAALILAPVIPLIPFSNVATFGIIGSDGIPGGMLFEISGQPGERVARFTSGAQRWWRGDNATGRPTGTVSRERLYDAYGRFYDSLGHAPKQAELAAEVGITARGLRKALPLGWDAFLDDAEAVRAHRQRIAAVTPFIVAKRRAKLTGT